MMECGGWMWGPGSNNIGEPLGGPRIEWFWCKPCSVQGSVLALVAGRLPDGAGRWPARERASFTSSW